MAVFCHAPVYRAAFLSPPAALSTPPPLHSQAVHRAHSSAAVVALRTEVVLCVCHPLGVTLPCFAWWHKAQFPSSSSSPPRRVSLPEEQPRCWPHGMGAPLGRMIEKRMPSGCPLPCPALSSCTSSSAFLPSPQSSWSPSPPHTTAGEEMQPWQSPEDIPWGFLGLMPTGPTAPDTDSFLSLHTLPLGHSAPQMCPRPRFHQLQHPQPPAPSLGLPAANFAAFSCPWSH